MHNEELHQTIFGLSKEAQEMGGTCSRPAKEDKRKEHFICLVRSARPLGIWWCKGR